MKLPDAPQADVPREKIVRYLLSDAHAIGRYKAAFFGGFGFDAGRWQLLANAIRAHAATHEVASIEDTAFGTRYTVDGPLAAPDGRRPNVRVVWFVDRDAVTPRFVTAYPIRSSP